MKLIDLLVKELPRRGGWPEGVTHIGQDYDRELRFYGRGEPRTGIILDELAVDHRKIGASDKGVTKSQYDSALAASDGWIEWKGGECPVDSEAIVEVKYRKPNPYQYNNDRAGDFAWSHDGFDGDIIAYRLQQPTKSEQVRADAWRSYAGITENDDESDLNECIGQDVDVVNHPSHYTKGSIECIDAIDSATVGKSGIEAVCVANLIKYLWRYEEKGGLESVRKAQWYLNKLISELESK